MPHLKKKRTVTKSSAPFDTFPTANTLFLIDSVFKIRVLNISTAYGVCGTTQVFSCGIKLDPFILIITAAEKTIAARSVLVNAPDRGVWQDTFRLALSTLDTFIRINLP
jgi:hypothetical protein